MLRWTRRLRRWLRLVLPALTLVSVLNEVVQVLVHLAVELPVSVVARLRNAFVCAVSG